MGEETVRLTKRQKRIVAVHRNRVLRAIAAIQRAVNRKHEAEAQCNAALYLFGAITMEEFDQARHHHRSSSEMAYKTALIQIEDIMIKFIEDNKR